MAPGRAGRERGHRAASSDARRVSFRARDVVSQQDASPDAGLRRGGRPVDVARRAVTRTDLQAGPLSPGLLSIQPLLYGSLLVAFRHLIRVPAELRANWGVQLAWRGQRRAFAAACAGRRCWRWQCRRSWLVVPADGGRRRRRGRARACGARHRRRRNPARSDDARLRQGAVHLQLRPGETGRRRADSRRLAFLLGASLFARLELAILTGANASTALIVLGVVFVTLRIASLRQRERRDRLRRRPGKS